MISFLDVKNDAGKYKTITRADTKVAFQGIVLEDRPAWTNVQTQAAAGAFLWS